MISRRLSSPIRNPYLLTSGFAPVVARPPGWVDEPTDGSS